MYTALADARGIPRARAPGRATERFPGVRLVLEQDQAADRSREP